MYGQIVSVGKKQAITVDNFMDKYCDLQLVKKITLGTESVSIFPYNIDDAFFVPYGNELCCHSLSSGVSQWTYSFSGKIIEVYSSIEHTILVTETSTPDTYALNVLDNATGEEIWSTSKGDGSITNLNGNRFIFHDYAGDVGFFECYSTDCSNLLWRTQSPKNSWIDIVTPHTAIIENSHGTNHITALSIIDGSIAWKLNLDTLLNASSFSINLAGDFLIILGGNEVFFINSKDGVVKWHSTMAACNSSQFLFANDVFIAIAVNRHLEYRCILFFSLSSGDLLDEFEVESKLHGVNVNSCVRVGGSTIFMAKAHYLLGYDFKLHKMTWRYENQRDTLFSIGGSFFENKAAFIGTDKKALHWYEVSDTSKNYLSVDELSLRSDFNNKQWQYLRQTPLVLMAPLADLDWGDTKKMLAVVSSHIQVIAEQGNLLVSTTFNDLLEELELLFSKWSRTPPDDAHQLAWTCTLLAMHQDQELATGYKQALYQLAENFACSPRGDAPLALSEIPPLKQQMLASYRQILLG